MSAPAALKAVSQRDSLAKTVRLLTRSGLDVQFRGHQPHVVTKGNKAIRMVLPEVNDNATPELLEAIQGLLDHEVGHIYYTPFAKATKAGTKHRLAPALLNIVEDIRLEKLLPRDLPGTKLNLERMYERTIPTMFDPGVKSGLVVGDHARNLSAVMVVALRALSGQKAFQRYMDDNTLWPHFMPLLSKMPDLARRLKALETFDDVDSVVTDMIAALAPPPAPPPPPPPEKPKAEPPKAPPQPEPEEEEESEDGDDQGDDSNDDGDDTDGDADGDNDGDADSNDAEDADDDADSDDGEGHGDGEGTDDGEGDEDDTDCSGDQNDEDEGEDEGGGTPDETLGDSNSGGKQVSTVAEALKELDPDQRKALYLYKQRKQSVAEIASGLNKSEDEILNLLRSARRRLGELLKGSRA